jgi:transposase
MAFKEHGMQEILAVLERVHRGLGSTGIARVTGRGKSTIGRWIATAKELGWSPDMTPSEELALSCTRRVARGDRSDP